MTHFMIPTITRNKGASLCRSGSPNWAERLSMSFKSFAAFLVLTVALGAVGKVQAQCLAPTPLATISDTTVTVDAGECFATLLYGELPFVQDTCIALLSATNGSTVALSSISGRQDLYNFTGEFDPPNWDFSGTGSGSFASGFLELSGAHAASVLAPAYDGFVSFYVATSGSNANANWQFLINEMIVDSASGYDTTSAIPQYYGFPVSAGDTLKFISTDSATTPSPIEGGSGSEGYSLFVSQLNYQFKKQVDGIYKPGTTAVTYSAGGTSVSFNVNVTGSGGPSLNDLTQLPIRDCDNNDTIDMRDNLEFGSICANQASYVLTVPVAEGCTGCVLPGFIDGVTSQFTYDHGTQVDSCTWSELPTYTIPLTDIANGGTSHTEVISWTFCDDSLTNCFTYGPLTYVFMTDSKAPSIAMPNGDTLYTADFSANMCDTAGLLDLALAYFNPYLCQLDSCAAGSTPYPLFDDYSFVVDNVEGSGAVACGGYLNNPPGDSLGGWYTDNDTLCGALTVEYKIDKAPGCGAVAVGLAAPYQNDVWSTYVNWTVGNDAGVENFSGSGKYRIWYRVYDAAGNVTVNDTAECAIIVIADNEIPHWDAATAATYLDTSNLVAELSAYTETISADGDTVSIQVHVDCNDPKSSAFLDSLHAFQPTSSDECSNSTTVDTSGVVFNLLACDSAGSFAGYDTMTNLIASYTIEYYTYDSCGNSLGNSMEGTFRVEYKVTDLHAPRWDTTQASSTLLGTVTLPAGANAMSLRKDTTENTLTGGPSTFEYTYVLGDTITYNVSALNAGLTPFVSGSDDDCYAPLGDSLSVVASDCKAVTYSWSILEAADKCDNNLLPTLSATSGTGADAGAVISDWHAGTYTVRYTATDDCGLSSTLTFTFEIIDDIDPLFLAQPGNIIDTIQFGNCSKELAFNAPFPYDNCDPVEIISVEATDVVGDDILLLTTASGSCNSVAYFSEAYQPSNWVQDNLDPTDGLFEMFGFSPLTGVGLYALGDTSGSSTVSTYCINVPEDGFISFDCYALPLIYTAPTFPLGITWDTDDEFGIYTSLPFPLPIFSDDGDSNDDLSRSVNVPVFAGDEFCFYFDSDGDEYMHGVVIYNFSFQCATEQVSGDFPAGVNTVTYTARTLPCGDPTSAESDTFTYTMTVTVVDTEAPNLGCLDYKDRNFCFYKDACGATLIDADELLISLQDDNCGIAARCIIFEGTTYCDDVNPLYLDCSYLHTPAYEAEYFVRDYYGNVSDTCNFYFNIVDTIQPLVCVPDNVCMSASAIPGLCRNTTDLANLDFLVCNEPGKPSCNTSTGIYYDNDTCGVTFDYTVVHTANCDGATSQTLASGTISGTQGLDLSSVLFPVGTSVVTIPSIVDGSGNQLTGPFSWTVTVIDDVAPYRAVVPFANGTTHNVGTSSTDDLTCEGSFTWAAPLWQDNCGVNLVEISYDYGNDGTVDATEVWFDNGSYTTTPLNTFTHSTFPKGTSSVTMKAYDKCANAPVFGADCGVTTTTNHDPGDDFTFYVEVSDDVPAYANPCPAGCDTLDVADVVVATSTLNDYDCSARYVSEINFTDDCDTLTVVKHVVDQAGNVYVNNETYSLTAVDGNNFTVAIDDTLYGGENIYNSADLSNYTYTFTFTDCGGNVTVCDYSVQVWDDQEPTIEDCQAADTVQTILGECSAEVVWDIPMQLVDNCVLDSYSWAGVDEAGNDIVITSVDPQGCTSKFNFTGEWAPSFWTRANDFGLVVHTPTSLTIIDFDFGGGTHVYITSANAGLISYNINGSDVTRTVQAGEVIEFSAYEGTTTVTDFQFLCAGAQHRGILPLGTNTITYTLSDGQEYTVCGETVGPNVTTCDVVIVVEDNEAPFAKCNDITVQVVNGADVTITSGDVDGGSTDNCAMLTYALDVNTFTCDQTGTTVPVTLTVTDMAGNSDNCTSNVTVQEVGLPVITYCPGSQTFEADAADCQATVSWPAPTYSDGCTSGEMTYVSGWVNGSLQGVGTSTVVYTYGGLTCEFEVKVVDVTAPSIEVTNLVVAPSPLNCTGVATWTVAAVDACGPVTLAGSHASGNTFSVGITTVTYTATDASGNVDTLTFNVTVDDGQDPIVGCKDYVIELDADGEVSMDALDILDFVDDNCSNPSLTLTQTSFTCADLGVNNETITATDAAGNTATCDYTVTVFDNIDPVAVCQDVEVFLDASGEASVTEADIDGGSSDNTTCVTLTGSYDFTCADKGDNVVTLTIVDGAGNSDVCESTVAVTDSTSPAITCAMTSVVTTDGDCAYVHATTGWDASAADNCDDVTVVNSYTGTGTLDGAVFALGSTDVTWTAEDAAGNTSSCTITVEVEDDDAPTIEVCTGNIVVANDATECGAVVTYDEPTFADNCDDALTVTRLSGLASGEMFPEGTTTISYVASDAAANVSDTCTFTVTVEDLEGPAIDDCPASVTLASTLNECDQLYSWVPPFDIYDNCPGDVTVTETYTDPMGNTNTIVPVYTYDFDNPGTLPAGLQVAQFPIGTSTVTYTATDDEGNSTVCSFTVTVTDAQGPTVACPGNTILASTCADFAVPDYTSLANIDDNCISSYTVTQSPAAGTMLGDIAGLDLQPGGTFTVTLSVEDNMNASYNDACSFNIVLQDFSVPVPDAASLDDVYNDCGGVCVAAPTAQNECGETIYGIPSGSQGDDACSPNVYYFGVGKQLVVWTFSLGNGSSATQTQLVEVVEDATAPSDLVCNDVVVELGADGTATLDASTVMTSATDNCTDEASLVLSPSTFSYDCEDALGTAALVLTGIIDGDQATGSPKAVELYVAHDIADLSEYSLSNYNNGSSNANGTFTLPAGSATAGTYLYVSAPGDYEYLFNLYFGFPADYTASVLFINGDDAMALSQNGSIIDVFGEIGTDGTGTVWSYENGWAYRNSNEGAIGDVFEPGDWTYTGPNGIYNENNNNSATYPMPVGSYTYGMVTVTVTDEVGNSSSCTVNVTVEDNINPTVSCLNPTVYLDATGNAAVTLADVLDADDDNCAVVSRTLSAESVSCADLDATTITLTVADEAGITASCDATVTVLDTLAPSAVCAAYTVELDASGNGTLEAADLDGGSADNCNDLTLSASATAFTCAELGDNTVTLTVADGSGNESTCDATVTVADNIAPSITCSDDIVSCCATQSAFVTDASDNCDYTLSYAASLADGTSISGDGGELLDYDFTPGISTVTFTATDGSGIATDCAVEVNISDATAPVAICIDDLNISLGTDGTVTIPADLFNGGSFDIGCNTAESYDVDVTVSVGGSAPAGSFTFDCSHTGEVAVTLFFTDCAGNTSQCTSVNSIDGSAVEAAGFAAGLVAGAKTDTVSIPVTVTNFNDVTAVNLALTLDDDDVASVLGGSSALAGATISVTGNVVTLSWADAAGVSLADGSAAMTVDVVLTGDVGDCSDVLLSAEATQNTVSSACANTAISGAACVNAPAPEVVLSGSVEKEDGTPVSCNAVNLSGDDTQTGSTDADGEYSFTVASAADYTIAPASGNDYLNGITTMDLIVIQLHILGLDYLDSDYQKIAADINNNGTISTIDLVEAQALILLNIPEFFNNSSWRYVDAAHTFAPSSPLMVPAFPESVSYNLVMADQDGGDFVAVKIGDVTGDASGDLCTPFGAGNDRSTGKLVMRTAERTVAAGQDYSVQVTAKDFRDMLGYQFTVEYDAEVLNLVNIVPGELESLTDANFGLAYADRGMIMANWFNALGETVADDAVLFTMNFTAKTSAESLSELIGLTSGLIRNEAYGADGSLMNVDLEFIGADANEFALLQNTPNPFKTTTIVGFVLPEATSATLTITDVSGRVLRVIEGDFTKGYNEVTLNRSELAATGVLYYKLDTPDYSATKKMITIE